MSGASRKTGGHGRSSTSGGAACRGPSFAGEYSGGRVVSTASRALAGHLFERKIPELLDAHRADVALAMAAHGDDRRVRLLVTHHEHVRVLLELGLADLAAEVFQSLVDLRPKPHRPQLLGDLPRVLDVPVR